MNSKSLFGETLKSIRKQTDMTQKDAASFLSISRQQYSHLENGHRLPSVEMIVRIATLYNLNPLELMLPLIPENVALDNPDTAYYLKNGMFTYPTGKPAFDADHSSVMPAANHTVDVYRRANDAHPELR